MSTAREERHENIREHILKAALELIDRDGVHKFSLRAVARKVKYSPAGLYEYFDSKDDIVMSLCQIADEKLQGYLSSVADTLPYHDYMIEMGLAYIKFARVETTYFRLSFVTLVSDRESLDEPVSTGGYHILFEAIQRGIQEGFFAISEGFGAEQIAYTFWSMVHGMAMLQISYLSGLDADFEVADREGLHRLVKGMMKES